jgi:ATP-binding cassette subfamily F protein uup
LSGGERGRLMLARALAKSSNLLVLDEPTNDLDLETLDLLQEMLNDYAGTVLLVSHDRDFLDRVATSVLAFEGDGAWQEYPGGYSDMVDQRGRGVETKVKAIASAEKPKDMLADNVSAVKPSTKKLSYKDKYALETLPGEMAVLEKDIATLQATLADPSLFARDAAAFKKTAEKLESKQTALAAAEERWLELEMLRDEIGGG